MNSRATDMSIIRILIWFAKK